MALLDLAHAAADFVQANGWKGTAGGPVGQFQSAAGIGVDGEWGPQTRGAALQAGLADAAAPPAYYVPSSGGGGGGSSSIKTLADAAAGAVRSYGWNSSQSAPAVKAFQSAAGITADGEWGPQTYATAVKAGASNPPPADYTPSGGGGSSSGLAATFASIIAIAKKVGLTLTPAPSGTAAAQGFKLRDAVLGAYVPFTIQFEGYTPYLYTDVKGLVTTGIGNLVDPIGAALSLPWKRADGSLATQAEIIDAWNTVKKAWPGVQSTACAKLTTIRLDKDGIAQLVDAKLKQNDAYLAKRWPTYAQAPADAQLAFNSWAWAVGPGAKFPQLDAAVNAQDWKGASDAIHINATGNPGVVPRNLANQLLLLNADAVKAGKGDPSRLYYLDGIASLLSGGAASAVGKGIGLFALFSSLFLGLGALFVLPKITKGGGS